MTAAFRLLFFTGTQIAPSWSTVLVLRAVKNIFESRLKGSVWLPGARTQDEKGEYPGCVGCMQFFRNCLVQTARPPQEQPLRIRELNRVARALA